MLSANIRYSAGIPCIAPADRPDISVIIPVYNEAENIPHLFDRLIPVLQSLGKTYEIVAVDDGSRDKSIDLLKGAMGQIAGLRIVEFCRNYGQTAAMMAGIDHAQGKIIVAIDADLQNEPADIPALLDKLEEGYDVVSGWWQERQYAAVRRNFVSRVANRMISLISGVHLHDYGCTLKAYRADVLKDVRLYGEMHRFIPIYAAWAGGRVVEMPVRHHPRKFGKSNYGLERVFKVVLDLIVVTFLDRYLAKPIYVFGGFGALALLAGTVAFVTMIVMKFGWHISMISTPLPLVVVMTFLVGVLSILMGLLAEIMTRTYFESQQRAHYLVLRVHELSVET